LAVAVDLVVFVPAGPCEVFAVETSFFVSAPYAFALWMLLLLAVVAGAAALARPRTPVPVSREADDRRGYAEQVSVAAGRAAATADRMRTDWVKAQGEVDAAWTAYVEADEDARRGRAATAYPLMSRARKPGENADRERWLHRAAATACRERRIGIAQLNDVYAHRGWDPRLHPVVQESALRNAVRDHRWDAYRAACDRERLAWLASESAAEALRTLRAEAAAAITRDAVAQPAAGEFWWAEQWTTGELPVAA
jgi:hypothetical protein